MANRSRARLEADVPFDIQERRMGVQLAGIIDEALDLAEKCGWRYALAYLISEKVPSAIIQRLLFGRGRVRRPSSILPVGSPSWKGSDDMNSLFESLRKRRSVESCTRGETPCASRSSARHDEID
jgi:hypothetical protein